ncbi:DUF6551 family protein [Frigoriglobus tundricola]|uniref:ParB/Sulfiredoxin domain-containing protein n=1 Tax=Frigoriglobus tundricola TaxID=2774151 RepID=A0A6M5YN62_9BACT|nr:DUF6551 family protein [Frigoriglobus tundricola]QJW94743.1 hypothetical protein FTUN_2265 [Frigoriglobus tundricola]
MAETKTPLPPDEIYTPNGAIVKKTDAYKWKTVDDPGRFLWLSKQVIGVDHSYQREQVNEARVNRIAAELSWVKFGVITVVRRGDRTYWCIDGQHRLLAAKKRSDVAKVPVMLFEVTNKTGEADGFLKINSDRGAVSTFSRFNALLTTRDATAVATQQMVEASGYRFSLDGRKYTVRCLAAVYNAYRTCRESATAAWELCVMLYAGDCPIDNVFSGLFVLERALRKRDPGRSLRDPDNVKIILALGKAELSAAALRMVTVMGKGGPKMQAAGIARAINQKRRKNLVPSLLDGGGDE